MIPILFDMGETAFASNGLGRLRDCLTCEVTEERNGVYELAFTYPVGGAHFDEIIPGRIVLCRHDDPDDLQPFDIVGYTKPIDGVVEFRGVHISYRQTGITAAGTNINSLADAFAVLTSSAQPSNPFTYSADFTSSAYASSFDGTPRSVRQFLGGIEGSILDAYGGEYEFDKFRVILHRSRGQVRDFVIRYGVNLLDYKDDTDYSETYTSCIPYWHGNDNGSDTTVVGSRVDLGGTAYNGQNVCAALDLSDKFQDKPTAAQLESFALSLMQSKQTNLPAQNIAVDFVRLQDMGYEGLDTLLQCNLCDSIKVEFPRYNMSGTYKIVKTVWDVLADKYDSMELGQLSTTLAEALGIQSQTDTLQSIDDLTVNDLNVTGGAAIAGALTVGGIPVAGCTHTTSSGSGYRYDYFKYTNGLLIVTLYWGGTSTHYNQSLGGYSRNLEFSWNEAFMDTSYTVSHSWKVGSGFAEPAGFVKRSETSVSLYCITNTTGSQSTEVSLLCVGRWK